jgi:pilus assembly protein Flp/PilA
MLSFFQRITRRDEEGASAVEYGLLVAAIAAIIVIIVFALGSIIRGSFKSTCEKIANGGASAANASCTT